MDMADNGSASHQTGLKHLLRHCSMDLGKFSGHWMGEAFLGDCPFKPWVERSSRSTLTAQIWGVTPCL